MVVAFHLCFALWEWAKIFACVIKIINDYNDINSLEAALQQHSDRAVAVLLEPLQGEGGILPGDPAFFARLRQLCDERQLLLISDEVQVCAGTSDLSEQAGIPTADM